MFESLENRRMLSGGTLTLSGGALSTSLVKTGTGTLTLAQFSTVGDITRTGTLIVRATDEADQISVIRDGNNIKYTLRRADGNTVTTHVHASKVKRVLVEAGSGNDKVFVDNELQKRCTVLAGGGNDNVEGNYGATLIGGSGNDKLALPPTRVFVADPEGEDTVTGVFTSTNIGPALLSGGDGNDTLVAGSHDSVVGGKGTDVVIQSFSFNRNPTPMPDFDPETDFGDRASGVEEFRAIGTIETGGALFFG